MSVIFKGYKGEVVIYSGQKIFYTLDPAAKEVLWTNHSVNEIPAIPVGAYCWALDDDDEVIYCGRRRMI